MCEPDTTYQPRELLIVDEIVSPRFHIQSELLADQPLPPQGQPHTLDQPQQGQRPLLAVRVVNPENRAHHRLADGFRAALRPHIVGSDDLVDDERRFLLRLREVRQAHRVHVRRPGRGLGLVVLLQLYRQE